MLEVARRASDEPVSLATVARNTHLSRAYLEQLAMALRNARLMKGVCGKGGGYRLGRDPADITVREILEAVMGPIAIVECVEDPASCMLAEFCECRPVYGLINQRITEALSSFTLADLLDSDRVAGMRQQLDREAVQQRGCPAIRGVTREVDT
ncbi:MAG: Rrf2 family transcriptional regulator [Acidobacteriota bacterium]|jgi:Rrf2 family protein